MPSRARSRPARPVHLDIYISTGPPVYHILRCHFESERTKRGTLRCGRAVIEIKIERAAGGCGGPADDDDGNRKIGEAGKNPWRARGRGGTHVSYVRAWPQQPNQKRAIEKGGRLHVHASRRNCISVPINIAAMP